MLSMMCLATAIYFEAGNQPVAGQMAVAEVILNRVADPRFPNTVCDVVKHDRGPSDTDCEFSYMCDGRPETIHDKALYDSVANVAWVAMDGYTNVVGDSLFFHADYIATPWWAREMDFRIQVGAHKFYHGF